MRDFTTGVFVGFMTSLILFYMFGSTLLEDDEPTAQIQPIAPKV